MSRPDPATVDALRRAAVRELRRDGEVVTVESLTDRVTALVVEERLILGAAERDALVEAVVDETLGLGPLQPLLRDPAVTEIMVCGPGRVFAERDGRVAPADARFTDEAHLRHVVDRILAPLGRRVDEASPMVDARLPDGSRVNVVVPPLALDGTVVTIRRFGAAPLGADDLVRLGTLSARTLGLLTAAVRARRNILVTGGTGSGKTTTLAALAGAIPPHERVVTIEDAAELRLPLPHVVRLESRPASLEGRGAVTIRALVRNALRMRPDRIVVGEVRGGEALDMLTAMSTGHEGSLSTLHASSATDALRRLQVLALMGDLELPYRAVAEQVAAAVDLVVHQARLPDGRRRVVEVSAVRPGDGEARLTPLVWRDDDGEQERLAPEQVLRRIGVPGGPA
jgi:pilus assembly protein CpaF